MAILPLACPNRACERPAKNRRVAAAGLSDYASPELERTMRRLAYTLTIALLARTALAEPPRQSLNTLQDVFRALQACWKPPAPEQSRPGMELTVQLSLKQSGEIFGRPRITYQTTGATGDQQLAYRIAMAEALKRCAPFPLSDSLGKAIAGRPLTMRFRDIRGERQA
jgi:hypothetical protein